MRFIHLADVHLGAAPDAGSPWCEQRENEIWETFQKVIGDVREKQVDLLLICGDLFHRQPLKKELRDVNYLFTTIPNTKVVLIAGNHDYLKENSYYTSFPWSKNVVCLFGETYDAVYLKELNTYVYGLSYYSQEITKPYYDHVQPLAKDACHILLAHGGDAHHIPIHMNHLKQAGFDYVALGHIHKPQIIQENAIAYSGSLEPLDHTETGEHGYILGEYANRQIHIAFCPCAKRQYISLELQTDGDSTQLSLEDTIRDGIQEHGPNNIYTITLVGMRDGDTSFYPERIQRLGNILEVTDLTEPDYDFQKLREQYRGTLIGEFIDYFPADRTPLETKALYYGIQALLQSRGQR
ncbi:MAG: exonuclease SbcCD subunit D [Lachnospiraceae bacterium]|nr:exonuclease SbcCD subunit D [Lachnospiraceae bacterium]